MSPNAPLNEFEDQLINELEAIRADLYMAESVLSYGGSMSPYLLNQASYHSEQVIEKSLQSLVLLYSEEKDDQVQHIHNISELLRRVEECRQNFTQEHPYLMENRNILSQGEYLRLNKVRIEKPDALVLFKEARDLFWETEKEFQKAFPNEMVKRNIYRAKSQNESLSSVTLNSGVSPYSNGSSVMYANSNTKQEHHAKKSADTIEK